MAKVVIVGIKPAEIQGKKFQILTLLNENNQTRERWVKEDFAIPMDKVADAFKTLEKFAVNADYEIVEFAGKEKIRLASLE